MTLTATLPFAALALSIGLLLAACAQRLTAPATEPMVYLAAETRLVARDIVDITTSIAHPIAGANAAYGDCVAAQYALIRGLSHVSRLTTEQTGQGDIVSEKTSFLLSSVAPGGKFVLNATEIVEKCKHSRIPTV